MTLTIVIPTKGRDTLERAIQSALPENQNGHECDILVVADTYGPMLDNVQALCNKYTDKGVRYREFNAGYNDWGYPQMYQAYTTADCEPFIMNIGDDDVMVPAITERIAQIVTRNGWHPYLFQAELFPSPHRGIEKDTSVILWNDKDRSIKRQKVTGQNLVVPNDPSMMGLMTDDFEFIRQTIKKWDDNVLWVPVITCRCY